jgi:GntR family galactonate operon transcriptional repressor
VDLAGSRGMAAGEGGQHEAVLEAIGRRIVAGEYAAGAPLDLGLIGNELGVSRSVVREALRVLDTLGMVRAWPKRGTFVRLRSEWSWLHPLVLSWHRGLDYDVGFLEAVAQMREIIEPRVAGIAALRRTEAEADELRSALAQMAADDWDMERFIEADVQFHRALLKATHNELLLQICGVVEAAVRTHDQAVYVRHWSESLALHREVADAVARGSAEDAEAAMRRVLAQALSDVKTADSHDQEPHQPAGGPAAGQVPSATRSDQRIS